MPKPSSTPSALDERDAWPEILVPRRENDRRRYFRQAELTSPASLQGDPLLDLPAGLASGRLVLRVFVSASGAVERSEIVRSTLSPSDEVAVLAVLRPWRFRAGERQGVAVGSQVDLAIDFDGPYGGLSQSSDAARWWDGLGGAGQ